MIKDKIEFEIDQKVTFNPYGEKHIRYVVNIRPHIDSFGRQDNRVFYLLSNEKGGRICTETSGLCIEESIYFKELTQED